LACGSVRADTVHLENGSIIQGSVSVLEVIPGETLKIQTADGSVYIYGMAEVTKVTKATAEKPAVFPLAPALTASAAAPRAAPTLSRKNPWVALGLSWLVPGGGQFYNGQSGKGSRCLGVFLGGLVLYWPAIDGQYARSEENRVTVGAFVVLGSTLFSLVDAPFSAIRINRKLDELQLSVTPTGARLALRF
jgi:TM2 domain-containing membrane protein YozV